MRTLKSLLLAACCLATAFPALAGEITGLRAEATSHKEWGGPALLVDGDPATAWVAGRSGEGPGKRLTFRLPSPQTIARLRIANGNQGEGLFGQFRCVTSAILVLHDSGVHRFTLRPEPGEQDVVFPPTRVASFDIIIEAVSAPAETPEPGRDKVAVSEVRVFSDAEGEPTAATVPASPAIASAPAVSVPAPEAAASRKDEAAMDYFAATKPGAAWIKAAVAVPADKPLPGAEPNPAVPVWMGPLVAGYFGGLASLGDGYIDVFAPSIRDREARALRQLRKDLGARADELHGARGDARALALNRPIIRGNTAVVGVSGVYRFTAGGRTYEFPVAANFSFASEGAGWRINGVERR